MSPSLFYGRMVEVMEELLKFTLLTRNIKDHLLDRYVECKENAEELPRRVIFKST